jgi:hypothetical protein
MGFANATGSEEHDILGTLHEGKTAEFENQSFRYAERKLEVEFIKRLDRREASQTRQHPAHSLRARHGLILQGLFEEVEIAELAFRGHLAEVRNLCRQVQQIKLLAQHSQCKR